MTKAQISFEFILLFTIVFFVFIAVGSIFSGGLSGADSSKQLAQNFAEEVKVMSITASLAETDVEATLPIPLINGQEVTVEVISDPDNILYVRGSDGQILTRVFLPKFDVISLGANANRIIIERDLIANTLSFTSEE